MTESVKAPEPKTVAEDMDARRVCESVTACADYIGKCQSEFTDFGDVPLVAVGLSQDEQGALVFDPEIYIDGMQPTVSVVTKRVTNAAAIPLCITIYPMPNLDLLLETTEGRDWVDSQLETQLNHSAVRPLRPVKGVDVDYESAELASQLPKTVTDYIVSSRGGSSKLSEAYDTFWKTARSAVGDVFNVFKAANITKRDLANCLQSKHFAEQSQYEHLESHSQGNLFEMCLTLIIALAKKDSLDVTLLEQWAEERETRVINPKTIEENEFDEDFDPMAALMALAAKEAAPANESEGETPAEGTEAEAAPEAATEGATA